MNSSAQFSSGGALVPLYDLELRYYIKSYDLTF